MVLAFSGDAHQSLDEVAWFLVVPNNCLKSR